MKYLIETWDPYPEEIVRLLERLDVTVRDYTPGKQAQRDVDEYKERVENLLTQIARHHDDYKKVLKELKACREAPKYIKDNADYVELVSLRAENQKLIAFKGILERAQKDIDISRYINDS